MDKARIAFVLYSSETLLDWRTQDKYCDLGAALEASGFIVDTVTWTGSNLVALESSLPFYSAVLTWVNPIHRNIAVGDFEALLSRLDSQGVLVASLPAVIEKIATKTVLTTLSGTKWVPEAVLHTSRDSLSRLKERLDAGQIRVTKQYRGNDGLGVYRIERTASYTALEANSLRSTVGTFDELVHALYSAVSAANPVIEMPWNDHLANGIIRCYFCRGTVAGLGYQEANALYPAELPPEVKRQRFYLTEHCGIFQGLRRQLETQFIPLLTRRTGTDPASLPILWDADFFINDLADDDFTLCEINASCVSPFPPSAIRHVVQTLVENLRH